MAGPDAPRLKLVRAGGVLKVPEASDSLCDPSERDGEGPLEGVEPEPPEAEEAAPFEPPEPFEPLLSHASKGGSATAGPRRHSALEKIERLAGHHLTRLGVRVVFFLLLVIEGCR